MTKYMCFKCQNIFDAHSEIKDIITINVSSDNYVFMCLECIKVSGNAAVTGQPAASPQLNKNGGLKCHKEQ